MHIAHLGLTNFRNYVRLELDLPPHFVVFQGDNAQGKTNLLESVYYLATSRSSRSSSDRDLINWLAQKDDLTFARIAGRVHKTKSSLDLDITLMPRQAEEGSGQGALPALVKRIRVNGLPRRATDLVGQVNVVMFSPQDIDLVSGPPHLRRRYLDIMNSQVDVLYLRALQTYSRVLVQRNHLLRLIRDRQARHDQLDFWNEQMVEAGAYIIARRQRTIEELGELAQVLHPRLTGQKEHIKISYLSNLAGYDPVEKEAMAFVSGESSLDGLRSVREDREPWSELTEIKESFRLKLEEIVAREVMLGMSVLGPHRDDLQLCADGIDLNVYGSRGQQRTAALSLKLSEANLMLAQTGEQPILLLDDIMSELDSERRSHLVESLAQHEQVLITTTDLDRYGCDFLSRASVFTVNQGQIERVNS
ncbi:MAG: DNA replication/repair protein RecF [Dehalococcoidia bacterium]|nr:DNA replication/repair protein RecF [Dehalococcoidia bacterium]